MGDGRVLRLLPWALGLFLPMGTPLLCPLSEALLGGVEMLLSCVLGCLQRYAAMFCLACCSLGLGQMCFTAG